MYRDKNLEFEIGLLETIYTKAHQLFNMVGIENPNHMSWSRICEIACPENPMAAKINLIAHIGGKLPTDGVNEVFDKLNKSFSNTDVGKLQSIAFVLKNGYADKIDGIIYRMSMIHMNCSDMDIEDVFKKSVN